VSARAERQGRQMEYELPALNGVHVPPEAQSLVK
jgi:hypothetical protein